MVSRRQVPRGEHHSTLPAIPARIAGPGLADLVALRAPLDHDLGQRAGDVGLQSQWLRRSLIRLSMPRQTGRWPSWWTLLHPPYTAWHLSYVVLGAAVAPEVSVTRLSLH